MTRKIIELGNGCMVLSLPIKWVRENSLSKGDDLIVSSQNNQIIISTDKKENILYKLELNVDSDNKTTTRALLINAYRAGYDKLIVEFNGEKSILSNIVSNDLLGFEIFQESSNKYTIESVSEPSGYNFNKIMNKRFFIVADIFNELFTNDISSSVYNVQKYDNFLKRYLVKQSELNNISKNFLWQFISDVTHVAKECLHLQNNYDKKINLSNEDVQLYNKIKEMFLLLREGYVNKDISKLTKIHSMEKAISKEKNIYFNKTKNPSLVYYLIHLSRIIHYSTSPLMGFILQLEGDD